MQTCPDIHVIVYLVTYELLPRFGFNFNNSNKSIQIDSCDLVLHSSNLLKARLKNLKKEIHHDTYISFVDLARDTTFSI